MVMMILRIATWATRVCHVFREVSGPGDKSAPRLRAGRVSLRKKPVKEYSPTNPK